MVSNDVLRRARDVAVAVDSMEARTLVAEIDGHRWFVERLPLLPETMFPGDDAGDSGDDAAA